MTKKLNFYPNYDEAELLLQENVTMGKSDWLQINKCHSKVLLLQLERGKRVES